MIHSTTIVGDATPPKMPFFLNNNNGDTKVRGTYIGPAEMKGRDDSALLLVYILQLQGINN